MTPTKLMHVWQQAQDLNFGEIRQVLAAAERAASDKIDEIRRQKFPKGFVVKVTHRRGKPSVFTAIFNGKQLVAGVDRWLVVDEARSMMAAEKRRAA